MSDFKCWALPVRQPSATFYVAAVKAAELLAICHPLTRPMDGGVFARQTDEPLQLTESQVSALVRSLESSKFHSRTAEVLSEERLQPYQRFLDEKRAVEISRYLEQPSSLLPNSIILAVNINYDEDDIVPVSQGQLVQVSLPRNAESAVILDGQHRVAALGYLPDKMKAEYELLVAFLIGIPFYQQAELFAIINGKQKPVNRSIIYDLFGYAPVGRDKDARLYEGLIAIERFCSHVARLMNRVPESPWQDKIRMRGPGDEGVISQAAVVEYLSALVEPKTYRKRLKVLPLLFAFFKKSDPAGCAALLILYLAAVRNALPRHWENRKSLLWKNNGVAVIFRILHDDLVLTGGVDVMMGEFRKLSARWKRAPENDLNNPPKTGGGGIQNQLYERFRNAMFTQDELARLAEAKEGLKDKLVEIGGLIR